MNKIGFIGVYDKTDLILCIAKVLKMTGKKVLIVDPTVSYITEFEEIDVAIGFNNFEEIRRYIGLEDNEGLEYDYVLIDIDAYDKIIGFQLSNADKLFYITSFDVYSLKKGIEILNQLKEPLKMTKIFYSKEMLKEEEEYFDYLALGAKAEWNEDKIYFLLENGDYSAIIENQRLEKIKFKNLSNEYRENVIYLVNKIDDKIGERTIRGIIKNL